MELFGKHDQLGHHSKADFEAQYISCKGLSNKITKDLQISLNQNTVELVMKYMLQFLDVFEIELASKQDSKTKNYRLAIILLNSYFEEMQIFSKSLKECLKEFKNDKGKKNKILFRLKRELMIFVIDSDERCLSYDRAYTSRHSHCSLRQRIYSTRTKIQTTGNCFRPTCR